MFFASQVTASRDWVEWLAGITSLVLIQLLGVAVALNLWRAKPKGRKSSSMGRKTEVIEENSTSHLRLFTAISDGSKAEESGIAISEIWRRSANQ
jgi:hypothetical protein